MDQKVMTTETIDKKEGAYAQAGVDIAAGQQATALMKGLKGRRRNRLTFCRR